MKNPENIVEKIPRWKKTNFDKYIFLCNITIVFSLVSLKNTIATLSRNIFITGGGRLSSSFDLPKRRRPSATIVKALMGQQVSSRIVA